MSELQKLAELVLFSTHIQCFECGTKLLQEKNSKMQKNIEKFSFIVTSTLEFIRFKYCVLMIHFLF